MNTKPAIEFSRPSMTVQMIEGKGPGLLELIGLLAEPAEDRRNRRGFWPKSFEFKFQLPSGELKIFFLHIHGVEGLSYRHEEDKQVHLVDGGGSALPRDEHGERAEIVHYIGTYNFHTRKGEGVLEWHVVRF